MFIPTSKWDFIIRSVSISSYLPGRIRLHSKKLIGNAELGRKVYAYIASYKEIDKVDINVLTGSVLITYRPQLLRTNGELVRTSICSQRHLRRHRYLNQSKNPYSETYDTSPFLNNLYHFAVFIIKCISSHVNIVYQFHYNFSVYKSILREALRHPRSTSLHAENLDFTDILNRIPFLLLPKFAIIKPYPVYKPGK